MTVKINGIEEVLNTFDDINHFNDWATPPMEKTVFFLHDKIAKYPQKASGAFSRLATPGQRRAYWAKVSSGEITHGANGYVRTGTTGRRWTTKVSRNGNGLRGEVGNNYIGAFFTASFADQQPFHTVSGWITDKQAIEENEDKIISFWARSIDDLLR